jgi:superfamily II DNA or RNA helicase
MSSEPKLYKDVSDSEFSSVLNKYEFSSNEASKKKGYVYQEPTQILLRNYVSLPTVYESVLLYHMTGVGKSCSAITIAEGFKEYVYNMGRKIVVLVKNKNIQRNFVNELLSKCTADEYLSDAQKQFYFETNTINVEEKNNLFNKVHRHINSYYTFLTYGSFVNRVLGVKEFEKDNLGQNTTSTKKVDGKVFRKAPKNIITNFNNTVVIVDEAHNVTNNDVYLALHEVLSRSYNFRTVLLTATPMYDNSKEIIEISNLLNINYPENQLPIRNDAFKQIPSGKFQGTQLLTKSTSKYVNNNVLKGGIISVTNEGLDVLKQTMAGKVSFLTTNTDTFPSKRENGTMLLNGRKGTCNVVYCQMSLYQYSVYLKALKTDLKQYMKYDMSTAIQNLESVENTFETVNFSKSSSLYKNCSDASTMVYPAELFGKEGFASIFEKASKRESYRIKSKDKSVITTDLRKYSSKLYYLLENLEKSPGPAFVYTNYVSFGGTSLLRLILSNNGYKEYNRMSSDAPTYIVFDESTNAEKRERYRRIFNSPENKDGKIIKVIIGSPIISEGITLKNVRQVHILEPAWNMSRINQIVGRAVRNMSHEMLPPDQRTVDIYKYVSVYYTESDNELNSSNLRKFFIDREKYILSEEKDRANKKVERLLKENSFDCSLTTSRNIQNLARFKDGDPECDYEECNYSCNIQPISDDDDKSTYNYHMKYFDKESIKFVTTEIENYFKLYFVWHIDDILAFFNTKDTNITYEVIISTLAHMVDNKVALLDAYDREGFLIKTGPFIVLNPNDVDVQSSIYDKMLNFEVDTNKYTLKDFAKLRYPTMVKETEKKKKDKGKAEVVVMSEEDIKYNNDILNSKFVKIFGTFRQRGTKENIFGPKDEKFRIVDTSKHSTSTETDDSEDKRKVITGMWIGSYKKPQLISIAQYLQLDRTNDINNMDKDQLAQLIQRDLEQKGHVLK